MTFFVTRIFIGAWGLYDVWRNKAHWETGSYGVHGVVVGFHLIFIMNIFWGVKVLNGFLNGIKNLKRM